MQCHPLLTAREVVLQPAQKWSTYRHTNQGVKDERVRQAIKGLTEVVKDDCCAVPCLHGQVP